MKWETVTNSISELGEGPVWDANSRRIIWIDISKGDIHQYDPHKKEQQTFHIDQKIGSVALKKSGGLIAALQHGFASIDIEQKKIKMIADPEADLPDNRFNDGKCDPAGRFWAGTMSDSGKEKAGSLYTMEKDLSIVRKISEVGCSNGLAWSSDHSTFYFIDTPTKQVAAYDYDIATGNINNRRIVVTIPDGDGLPDGMTIDSEGMLWIALWGGWKVQRWNPHTGKLLDHILLPVSQVTCCTFGGETFNDLYITSAKEGLADDERKKQPLAGSLFVVKNCGYTGLPAVSFHDS